MLRKATVMVTCEGKRTTGETSSCQVLFKLVLVAITNDLCSEFTCTRNILR